MSDDHQEPSSGRTSETRSRDVPRPQGPPPSTEEPPPHGAVWSGRAEVPPPRSSQSEPAGDWYVEELGDWYVEELGDRRWWMPIAVASTALVVLAALGLGLWLVVRPPGQRLSPGPLPSSPSAAPPNTEPPLAPGLGPVAGDRLLLPDLVGLPREAAEAELDRLGLGYRSRLRPSDQPAGTVVDTEPGAGTLVPVGTDVTLVLSEPAVTGG